MWETNQPTNPSKTKMTTSTTSVKFYVDHNDMIISSVQHNENFTEISELKAIQYLDEQEENFNWSFYNETSLKRYNERVRGMG